MKKLVGLLFLAVLSSSGMLAHAGYKSSSPVTINDTTKSAQGSLGTARNSSDVNQYIGCWVQSWAGAVITMGCDAGDASGKTRSCMYAVPEFVTVASAIRGDSYIAFSWDSYGNCTSVSTGFWATSISWAEPKK